MDSAGIESRSGQEIFLFSHNARTGFGANPQTLVQWVPGLCPVVKRPGREVNHSSSSSAEFKNYGAMPLLSLYTFMEQKKKNVPHNFGMFTTNVFGMFSTFMGPCIVIIF
jgi:hypothetical protein